MRVLITGGCGFIGSHLVESYQGVADEIRVLDNLRSGYRHNLDGLKCTFIDGSITDRALVAHAMRGVDYVYHLAALVSVPESMAKPAECVEINVTGLLNVLDAAAAAGVRKLVFASSAAIYGDNPTVPKLETMVPEPKSPYAITKLDGEYYLDIYQREGRLETAALRFFNVFGARQDPKGAYAAAVPIFIQQAIRHADLTIFGDGGQTRDFIYVKDIVGALTFAAHTSGVTGVFNAGYGGQMTINQLASQLIAAAGSSSAIIHGPARAGDVKHSRASADKLRAAGWVPQFTLEQGLGATLADCRACSGSL